MCRKIKWLRLLNLLAATNFAHIFFSNVVVHATNTTKYCYYVKLMCTLLHFTSILIMIIIVVLVINSSGSKNTQTTLNSFFRSARNNNNNKRNRVWRVVMEIFDWKTHLFGPGPFYEFRINDLGPSLLTLNVTAIVKVRGYRVPSQPITHFFGVAYQLL